MPTYNPNDFYPRTGQEIKSDGTTVNEADGINADGSENVVVEGSKTVQTKIATGVSVGAGATVNLTSTGQILNMINYSRGAVTVVANASHSYTLSAMYCFDGSTPLSSITSNAGTSFNKSINFTQPSDYLIVQITNSDTVAHTYDVYTRQMQ